MEPEPTMLENSTLSTCMVKTTCDLSSCFVSMCCKEEERRKAKPGAPRSRHVLCADDPIIRSASQTMLCARIRTAYGVLRAAALAEATRDHLPVRSPGPALSLGILVHRPQSTPRRAPRCKVRRTRPRVSVPARRGKVAFFPCRSMNARGAPAAFSRGAARPQRHTPAGAPVRPRSIGSRSNAESARARGRNASCPTPGVIKPSQVVAVRPLSLAACRCGLRIWRHLLSSSRRSLSVSLSTLWILAVTEADACDRKNKRETGKRSRGKSHEKRMEVLGAHRIQSHIQYILHTRSVASCHGSMTCHACTHHACLVLAKVVMPEPVRVGVHSISFSLVPLHQ